MNKYPEVKYELPRIPEKKTVPQDREFFRTVASLIIAEKAEERILVMSGEGFSTKKNYYSFVYLAEHRAEGYNFKGERVKLYKEIEV